MDTADHTEGGRYNVVEIRMGDGSVELRRYATCKCGVRRDVDITTGCPMGCDTLDPEPRYAEPVIF